MAMNLSKQKTIDADRKAKQEINLTGNLEQDGNATIFFIAEEAKKNHFRFFTTNCESIVTLFSFNIISI